MNPTILLSLLLIGTTLVSAQSGLSACNVYCANTAVKNQTIGPSGSVDRTAYFFDNGFFAPSVYEPQEGHCTLQAAFNDNQLTVTGVVYDPANPTTGFFINIQSSFVSSGESYLELDASAYVTNGGWLDPSTWAHYSLNSGTLTGFGTWQGVTLSLAESMHPLQAGVGANGKNGNLGLSAWFEFQYNGQTVLSDINVDLVCPPPPPTAAPTVAPTPAPATDAPTSAPVTDAPTSAPVTDAPTSAPVTDAPTTSPTSTPSTSGSGATGETSTSGSSSSTGEESYICPPNPYVARQSIADQYGGNSYFAFIFNTSTNIQYRFDFVNDNGRFTVNADGTASLTGTLAPLSSNAQDGVFDFDFSAVVNFIPGSVPAEFHKELQEDAYVPNGPVDPTTWIFYAFSSATITPTNSRYSLSIAPFMDMEFQVGVGANGKNANYGASAWFSFFLVDNTDNALIASGVMDIDIDLLCSGPDSSTSGSGSSGSGSASSGSGSDASTTSVVSDGSISGGEVTPSTSASPSPATTASSASVVSTSMAMLVMLLAIALNL